MYDHNDPDFDVRDHVDPEPRHWWSGDCGDGFCGATDCRRCGSPDWAEEDEDDDV